jgi:hypothetical protein
VYGGQGLLVTQTGGAGTIAVEADHDAVSSLSNPSGTYSPTNVTAVAPAFVNAAANDYHEASNSTATIDAGTPIPAGDPATDIDGDPRTIGSAPDIGADELLTNPSAAITGVSGVGPNQASVSGVVAAGGRDSQALLEYGTTTAYGQQTSVTPVPAAANGQAISFPVTGLAPGTLYHARITISNQAGTFSSTDATFTTAASSGAPPPGPPSIPNAKAVVHETGHKTVATPSGTTFTLALPLTVSCPAKETCQITITLTVPAATATAAAKRKHAAKPIVIGTARITLRAGKRLTPKLKLNRTGASLLRRRRKLGATFSLKVIAGGSATTTKSGHLVITVKGHKPY